MDKRAYREVLGGQLRAFREERGVTLYRVAQNGNIRIDQVKAVESGEANYTIDAFLGYIAGCDLYITFGEKSEQKSEPLDLKDMIKSLSNNDPHIKSPE